MKAPGFDVFCRTCKQMFFVKMLLDHQAVPVHCPACDSEDIAVNRFEEKPHG